MTIGEWLFDLFVSNGVTAADVAPMDAETVEWAIGELREPGVAEDMSDAEIAEAILEYANEQK